MMASQSSFGDQSTLPHVSFFPLVSINYISFTHIRPHKLNEGQNGVLTNLIPKGKNTEKVTNVLSNSKGKIQVKVNLEGYATGNSTNKA